MTTFQLLCALKVDVSVAEMLGFVGIAGLGERAGK
jgi:hypothetical protein